MLPSGRSFEVSDAVARHSQPGDISTDSPNVLLATGARLAYPGHDAEMARKGLYMALPARSGSPAGLIGWITTLILNAVAGVIVLPVLWLLEGALQYLRLIPADVWVTNALSALPCLLWLAALLALARRGRTPASLVMRRRWGDAAGKPVRWRPLGSLSFWLAAWPALFMALLFGEDLCVGWPDSSWNGWPPPFENYGLGLMTACLMTVAIALPPYLRCRRLAASFGPARRLGRR